MKLYVTSTKIDDDLEVDINWQLQDECCVTNAEQLFCRMLVKVCNWVANEGGELSDVYCNTFDGDEEEGFDLGLASGSEFFERLRDVALLAWYLHEKDARIDEAQVFAVIENERLKYFNFENIKESVEDDFYGEVTDGVEEWARQYMEDVDTGIPDHLKDYFDFEQYGEDLMRDAFSKVEYGGRTWLYGN